MSWTNDGSPEEFAVSATWLMLQTPLTVLNWKKCVGVSNRPGLAANRILPFLSQAAAASARL